ncbi:CBS domain-containing protein [Fusobacterium canifelinum]|uniref:CBS domain-containing protein n=1 Tax=Fusobacterium canifelinum TaxID=285729 RepID=A0ABX7CEN1_9FUSO|nr:CBS domain-containing protein [Fusobacterium canifelinum]QQS87410.1 CBS domain-containing protein [Fusobacterium canifelinum]
MKGSISIFRDLCNKFEDLVRIKYKVKDEEGAFYILSNQKEYKKFEKDINLIRKIRNLLSHGECKVEGKVTIEINENIIEKLKEIISLLENPPLVTSRYISEMFVVDLEEKLENLIKTMNEKKISHVPVLDKDKKLVGVFSENTIFSKLSDDEIIEIGKEYKVKDYEKYIKLENHSSEYFDFIKRNEELASAQNLFNKSIKKDKKLVMLFVTENGKKTEKILGIITPWDLLDM